MPVAVNALVMTGVDGWSVSVSVAEPVPPAFDALIVGENVPVTVGVPEITPVAESTLNPAGRFVAL